MPHPLRIAVILLAICATLAVASVSVLPEHLHAKAPSPSCELCFVAHTVGHEATPIVPAAHVPVVHERLPDQHEVFGYQSLFRVSRHTRGPPSFLPL